MINCKLIIGIIASNSSNNGGYNSSVYDDIVKYYISRLINYIEINNLPVMIFLLYDSNSNTNFEIDKRYIIKSTYNASVIPGILLKTLDCLEFINNNYNFNYFFRTNLSSFIEINNLLKFINKLPKENVYAGCGGHHNLSNGIYISGAGYILSNDNVKFILDNQNIIREKFINIIDDCAIGAFFNYFNKKISNLENEEFKQLFYGKCYELYSRYGPLNYKYRKLNRLLNDSELKQIYDEFTKHKYYHSRIKNGNNRFQDLQIFKYLTDKIYGLTKTLNN